MAVGVLYSNVLAYVEDDAVLSAAGDITVYARGDLPGHCDRIKIPLLKGPSMEKTMKKPKI
jgi:hypothetical protein